MIITSASIPYFLKRPFSSATQILPEVALMELADPELVLGVGKGNKNQHGPENPSAKAAKQYFAIHENFPKRIGSEEISLSTEPNRPE
jgi:hypothetical protein